MKRWLGLIISLLVGMVTGCVDQGDIQGLRADLNAFERQTTQQHNKVKERLQILGERVVEADKSQTALRQQLTTTTSGLDDLQATSRNPKARQPGLQSSDLSPAKLREIEERLATLEREVELGTSPRPSASTDSPATSPPEAPQQPPQSGQPDEASPDRLYQRAQQAYQQGQYDVAIRLFKQYLQQSPRGDQAVQAQFWIGKSLVAQKEPEAAIVAFDDLLLKYPRESIAPAALLEQGKAFAQLQDQRNARHFYQQVMKKFPQSPEAQQAAEQLKQLGGR